MGDAQSAQREDKKDAAAEEASGGVDEPSKNNGQSSEINGKADGALAEVNGPCEDEIAAEAIISSEEDVSATEQPLKEEETPLDNVEMNEKESPNEGDADEDVSLEMTEMDAKQNDINEGFGRFFSNIGLKLTVKRGSSEIPTDVPGESNKNEPNRPEDIEDNAKEAKSENAEQNTDVNITQETYDNDSTTCPTLTDITSEDVLGNVEEKATETKEEVESDRADAATTSPVDAPQDATPEEEPQSTSPSSPEEEVVASPIKRFFSSGIFSGLRKKKKPVEDDNTEKELVDMREKEVVETTEQTAQNQQHDKEEITQGVEEVAVETEYKEDELKAEILSAALTDEGKSPTVDASTIIVTEPEILSSQEKDKVPSSPLKRLLSGSSLKKLSKKQRSRRSSDGKLSDSGEHVSDQLLSSTESAEHQKEEGPAQPSAEAAGEEDGAWASFKKLVTPKKRMKRSSLSIEETQIPGTLEVPKPSEGEQISDHSTEEGKKRKDSSVSWEAVLCGSGRRRSRKTSDSEDETPQIDNDDNKQDSGSKHGAESSNENENDILASSPKQAGSPSESDGGSTWKSLKRLVTTKKKAKDEDESKDNVQSDSEVIQDESSFSITKLLPGRKKRKSAEKQDQVSSDEADKDVASGDEDSDTPAVVPLSEFDTAETEVHIQIQADVESHIPEEADYELQQDLLDQMAELVLPCDSLQAEAKKVKGNDNLEKQASTTLATNEEPDELTESISNHQQLSDIPEEGIITETMATPASLIEDTARDDTIAEDLIDTSEAVTAPEAALDITLADETEMISAVSQLSSESSKTSGNATPVPAEYDVIETDVLLHQVVETIYTSPKEIPGWSDELSSERIVGSVSHQILETFVKVKPTILEIHRRLDASAINTGLTVEKLDAIIELAATSQTESISEANDSVSTEIVSEVATEEFDTAEIAVDEVYEVNITHPEDSVKELESIDESYDLMECLSELNAAGSTDMLPDGEEIVPDQGSLVEAHYKTDPAKMDSQEADSADTVADKTKNGFMEQEVQTLTEKKDQIMHNINDQAHVDDKDQPQVEVEELQELAAVQAATVESEETGVQSLGKTVIPEDIAASETVTYEPKEEAAPPTEVNDDPEKEDELETDVAVLQAVQSAMLDLEAGSLLSYEKKVISEEIPAVETVTDESRQTAEHLTEVSIEPENKELAVNTVKTEHVQEPKVLETVQAPTLESEDGSVQSLEKAVISEDTPEAETVTDEPKEKTIPLIEVNLETVDASKVEHVQEPDVLQAVQSAMLDLEAGSLLSHEKKVISEEIPAVETVTDESRQTAEHLTEHSVESKNKELPVNAVKIDHVQIPEALKGSVQTPEEDVKSSVETVTDEPKQTSEHLTEVNIEPESKELAVNSVKTDYVQESEALDGSVKSPEEEIKPEDTTPAETIIDEAKQRAEHLTEVSVEPENKELPVNAVKTEHVQEPKVLETFQAPTLDSEDGSVQSLEKEVISEDTPEAETVTDEPKEKTIPLIEVSLEPVDASNAEHVQEPDVLQAVQSAMLDLEAGSLLSHEKEGISEENPAVETEKLPVEAAKTVQEPKVLPSDVKDTVTETKTEEGPSMYVHVVTENIGGGSAQDLEKQILLEDVPKPNSDDVITSVTDQTESQVVAQLDQALKRLGVKKTESIPQDVEQVDSIPEVVHELQTLTAVHVSSINEEARNAQVLEKTIISEETPAPCVDNAAVTDEPKHEVHLCAVQVSVEGEKESDLSSTVIKTAALEHAVAAQVVTCNLKEVSVEIPDILIEKTTDITEPLINRVASELMFQKEVETATRLVKGDVAETAEVGSMDVIMHVPLVHFEGNHRIQVQVVDVNLKSAETIVDSALEVGVTEAKEVIDVRIETVTKVDNLSATPEIEKEIFSEENKVTIQDILQHVKENLTETVPESVVANLEEVVIRQSDAATEVSELVESESNEVKDQKAMKDSIGTFKERQDEAPVVISDDSPERQVSEDLMPTPDIPGSLDVSFHDHKEDLEETEAEWEKSEAGVTAEKVKSSSEELDLREQAPIPQIAQCPIVTPSNTGLVGHQNTGIMSSIGNVECPSSLSLEFKLNIQFGQAKAPASPSPTTERIEQMKQKDMSVVGVQQVEAAEPVKSINPTHRAESQKQTEQTDVAVQVTEITEPVANLDSTERAVNMTQPVLLDVCVQTIETVEPITSAGKVTFGDQATETIQPVRSTEKREVFLSQPIISEASDQEIKAEEPVEEKEEENDQDVWMDAEEVPYIQKGTEVSLRDVEESLEPPPKGNPEEKAGLEHEVEMASNSKSEEEESQQEMHKTENESQVEDFSVAPEHPETETSSITTME